MVFSNELSAVVFHYAPESIVPLIDFEELSAVCCQKTIAQIRSLCKFEFDDRCHVFKSVAHPTSSLDSVHANLSIQDFGVHEAEQVVFDGPGRHLGSVEKSFGVASTNDGPTDDHVHD